MVKKMILSQMIIPFTCDVELPRKSQDNTINANGHLLLDFLKQSGLRVTNGRVCEDKDTGAVTFVGSRGTSLVDYCIVNPELFKYFKSFYVHDPNIISDHCLIEFSIVSKPLNQSCNTQINENDTFKFYKWKSDLKEDYITKISSNDIINKISTISHTLNNNNQSSAESINSSISSFINVIDQVCAPMFEKNIKCNPNNDKSKKRNSEYENTDNFNESCGESRSNFFQLLNIYRLNKSDENRNNMVHARTIYKNDLRKYRTINDRLKTS